MLAVRRDVESETVWPLAGWASSRWRVRGVHQVSQSLEHQAGAWRVQLLGTAQQPDQVGRLRSPLAGVALASQAVKLVEQRQRFAPNRPRSPVGFQSVAR
ncbi:MAG: hypothetical protein B7Z73_16500 [Planctomycetia bacterium 21-64-5]|nr:MAG: hypothetical protein B7Z73_16500 [Planctomycetia bacterium 21-64-5]